MLPIKRLGKYVLHRQLGQGGMGVVFLAFDERLQREVAVKILPQEAAKSPEAVKRFLREARAAARVNHPNVVSIYDVGQKDGFTFLVMELLTGGSVQDLLIHGPLDWRLATRMVADACRGLTAAHAAGLIHRDIKPANLMLAADGTLKLVDFGLVKDTAAAQHSSQPGTVMGTPHYMSPEQCEGNPLDPRSDLYSLGATWFALLTARAPFGDLEPLQAMFAHCSGKFPDPRTFTAEIPASVIQVLQVATAKERDQRFTSAAEMLQATSALLQRGPESKPPSYVTARIVASTLPDLPAATPVNLGPTMLQTAIIPGSASDLPIRKARSHRLTSRQWLAIGLLAVAPLLYWVFRDGPRAPRPAASSTGGADIAASTSQSSKLKSSRKKSARSATTPFPAEFTLSLLWDLPDAGDYIHGVCIAPDGNRIFTASYDGKVREWDVANQAPGRVLTPNGFSSPLHTVAISPNGRQLVAGGADQRVFAWRLSDGAEVPGIECISPINVLAYRPDGERLAMAGQGELRTLNVQRDLLITQSLLAKSQSTPFGAYMTIDVAYSPDCRWLGAVAWENKAVGIWNAETDELVAYRDQLAAQPRSVSFVPDQAAVLLGLSEHGLARGVYRWDFEPRGEVRALLPDTEIGAALQVTPDGRAAIAVGGWEMPIYIVDPEGWRPAQAVNEALKGMARCAALSPRHGLLAVAGGDEHGHRGHLKVLRIVPARAP